MRTYNELYMQTRNALRDAKIEGFALEARILVATAAGKTTQELMRDLPLYTSPQVEKKVGELTARRLGGEPVAYITGSWEFYGLPMVVTSDVLIPRMDTERIVDTAKELLTGRNMNARILDLCCGSGCIACAVAHEMPATHIVAVDLSATALEIARKNIAVNRLTSRVLTLQADATQSPPMSIGKFDMILSNPPYIPTTEILTLDASVRDYEPIWALDGGETGLKFYKAIIKYWKHLLNPGGYLVFEVGENQAADVEEMLQSAGFRETDTRRDSQGIDRVVFGRM